MDITIRHAEPNDYVSTHRLVTSQQVIWGTYILPHTSLEQARQQLQHLLEKGYLLVACTGDEVVGSIGLHVETNPRRRHCATIGMAVRDDWQGKGIGSALMAAVLDLSDNWLNIMRIELVTWVDNERAIALYKKYGFEIEGTCRCYAFRAGHFVDAYAMARIRIR